MGELQGKVWHAYSKPNATGSTIELSSTFAARAIKWWKKSLIPCASRLQKEDSKDSSQILMVSHGGFIGTLVQELYGSRHVKLAPGVKIGHCLNTAICEIVLEGNKGTIVRYGDVSHLEQEAVGFNVDTI
jgi:2,3-bisphosphoglycerate-dependent phosphoglycerate mutase